MAVIPEVVDRVTVPLLPGVRDDTTEFRHNRGRARRIVAAPAVVAFVIVAGACVAAGLDIAGVVAGVVVGIGVWVVLWRGATGIVLRALRTRQGGDTELSRADNIVDGLCASMGVEPPDIVVVDDDARRALALGRPGGDAVLVVTSGLLDALGPVALEGVLAHELVHVKRGDTAPATMAAAVLLPVAAVLPVANMVHALAGRGRELRTDRLAVAVTRYPPGLREALVVMADGPASSPPSPLAGRAVAQATRWLWTVALPDSPEESSLRADLVGELDAPAVRIAALDEW